MLFVRPLIRPESAGTPQQRLACDGVLVAEAEHGSRWAVPSPLTIILVAGVVVRLGLWLWFAGEPLYVWDERDYDLLARNLVEHREFAFEPGTPTSLRPPLYPFFLAGVYTLCGVGNFQAVRLLQAVLGLLTVVVLHRLGSRVHSPKLGIWIAGLYCFYPSMLGQSNLLLTETLFTFLLCLACYTLVTFYQQTDWKFLAAAGFILGLATLTRSILWMSPPCLALYLMVTCKVSWRQRLLIPVTLGAAYALAVAPWSVRNSRIYGTFVAVDTMGGRNFMMGNYRYTPLYRSWDAISLRDEKSWNHELRATLPQEEAISQARVDQLAFRHGLRFISDHPWLTLQRDIIKFFDFWGLEREFVAGAKHRYWGGLPREAILALSALIFGSYTACLMLAVFGAAMNPLPDRRFHWLLLSVIAYFCSIHTLVFAHSRYHLPVIPLVLVFSASAIVHAPALWQQRHAWSFRLAAVACIAFVGGWMCNIALGDGELFIGLLQPSG